MNSNLQTINYPWNKLDWYKTNYQICEIDFYVNANWTKSRTARWVYIVIEYHMFYKYDIFNFWNLQEYWYWHKREKLKKKKKIFSSSCNAVFIFCKITMFNYTPAPRRGRGVYCFTSIHPSKIFFSVTVDGRNLIFGHKLHIGILYCG